MDWRIIRNHMDLPSAPVSVRSSWASTVMLGIVTLLWMGGLVLLVIPFAMQWFRELGVQLPGITLEVIDNRRTHVVVTVLLLGALFWRQVDEWRIWATGCWLVLLLLHVGFVLMGLVVPFIGPGR